MSKITYANKVKLNDDPNIPAENKVRDVDMNEIKTVVNDNFDEQKEDINWKYYNSVSGSETLALPESFNELFIAVRRTGASRTVYLAEAIIPYAFLTDDTVEINVGGRLTLQNQGTGAIGQISKTSYQTSACYLSSSEITTYETLIYYR